MNKLHSLILLLPIILSACSGLPFPDQEPTGTATESPPTATPTDTPTPTTVPTPTEVVAPQTPDVWTRIEPGGETSCAHGTPYAYWVRPANPEKILVYFQGGGGCWDAETCRPGSDWYDQSVNGSDNPRDRAGMFDLDNPENPFSDHTIIYLPSCTGDVHMGDHVRSFKDVNNQDVVVHFKGFVNAFTALNEWLYQYYPDPESVFVTGCSAGSVGSIAHAPYIIEQYPGAQVTQMGDSLAFVFGRPLDMQTDYMAHDNFASWIPALADIAPGEFLMSDFYSAIANYYPDHTFSQFNSAFDTVQIRFFTPFGGPDPADFNADLFKSLDTIHENAENFRSFTEGGTVHCALPRPDLYTFEVDGTRLIDWITALENGDEVETLRCEDCEFP